MEIQMFQQETSLILETPCTLIAITEPDDDFSRPDGSKLACHQVTKGLPRSNKRTIMLPDGWKFSPPAYLWKIIFFKKWEKQRI